MIKNFYFSTMIKNFYFSTINAIAFMVEKSVVWKIWEKRSLGEKETQRRIEVY